MTTKFYRNRLEVLINDYCKSSFRNKFKPNRAFFQTICIGQKRFWQLVRNETEMTYGEMNRLAVFFDVAVDELHTNTAVDLKPQNPVVDVPKFDYVTQEQAMSLLNLKKTKIWELRRDGLLTEHKVGRKIYFHRQDVVRLVADGKQ